MTPLESITARVNRHGDVNDPATPRPLLTLAEFFEGNETVGSIGCNLVPVPEPAEVYKILQRISARSDVADVRVQITMFDDPDWWPFSDTIWIITSADPSAVMGWFEDPIRPDDCAAGWPEHAAMEPCPVPPGMHAVGCWWD